MKSEVKEIENIDKKERVYPYIGKSTHITESDYYNYVLFTQRNTGIVLCCNADNQYFLGYYSDNWNELFFEVLPSTTQIILQND